MIRLYSEFERFRVDALVPWPFFSSLEDIRQHDEHFAGVAEKFNEEAHLLRIRTSDVAYVVNPGGYIGLNSAIDIGAALEAGKPIYSMEQVTDHGIAVMLMGVKNPQDIVSMVGEGNHSKPNPKS